MRTCVTRHIYASHTTKRPQRASFVCCFPFRYRTCTRSQLFVVRTVPRKCLHCCLFLRKVCCCCRTPIPPQHLHVQGAGCVSGSEHGRVYGHVDPAFPPHATTRERWSLTHTHTRARARTHTRTHLQRWPSVTRRPPALRRADDRRAFRIREPFLHHLVVRVVIM